MSAKHTPGPWFTKNGQRILSQSKSAPIVAQVNTVDGDDFHREMLANASLITAAPELLAACEAALELIEPVPCTEPPADSRSTRVRAERAIWEQRTALASKIAQIIAKAKGEKP